MRAVIYSPLLNTEVNERNRYMLKFIDYYNVAVGAVVALLSAIFGAFWYIFAAYFVMNVIDWLTGWYKSRKLHEESSKVGIKGILKKLGYWVIIAVAFLMSNVFVKMGDDILHIDLTFLSMIGWFTLACLLVNEVRSVVENLVECGYNVPQVLVSGLAVADKMINKNDDKDEKEHE